MTRKFNNGYPQRLPAYNFLSQYYFYNIFLQKKSQILAKFEAVKTGSGVGFLRFTALCSTVVWKLTAEQRCISRVKFISRQKYLKYSLI